MKLYDTDYKTISPEDSEIWKQLKEKEIVYYDGKPTRVRKSLYTQLDFPTVVGSIISSIKQQKTLSAYFNIPDKGCLKK